MYCFAFSSNHTTTRPHDHTTTPSHIRNRYLITSSQVHLHLYFIILIPQLFIHHSLPINVIDQFLPCAFEYFKLLESLSTRGFAPGKSQQVHVGCNTGEWPIQLFSHKWCTLPIRTCVCQLVVMSLRDILLNSVCRYLCSQGTFCECLLWIMF